jgi:hypothetical protein
VRQEFVLVVAVPVFRDHAVIYALAAAVWPERLADILTAAFSGSNRYDF